MDFYSSLPAQTEGKTALLKAWVVFSGQTDVFWLKFLRRGFRHCFVLIHDGTGWVTVDPMLHYMEIKVHHQVAASFDLPRWLCAQGHIVMPAPVHRGAGKPAPVALFSCVEAVKRFLGLHHRFIFTPWQLYRYLQKTQDVAATSTFNKGEPSWGH